MRLLQTPGLPGTYPSASERCQGRSSLGPAWNVHGFGESEYAG